jgi:GH25 family lysozyme M1 (1,4-beta-N-acetylmuramidase)
MTRRRFAALAQALVIAVILVPGLPSSGPAVAQRGEASARGLGCTTGGGFRGPRIPGDPPPPPGSGTTQIPVAPGEPLPSTTPLESPSPELDPPESQLGDGATALLASTDARLAQAGSAAESPAPATDAAEPPTDDAGPAAGSPDPANESVGEPEDPASEARPRRDRKRVRGIDVSHHNGDIDYGRVLDAGRTFAYIKATQDTSFRDPMFALNLQRARQAGVLTGAYHFFDYTLDGAEQADHFLDHIDAAGGLLGSLPPVVDVECWGPSGISTHLTSAERLRAFIDRVYERSGRLPVVYTSVFMWDQVVGGADGFADLPLWAACWGCDAPPSLATGWDDWRFWQTGVSRIPQVGRLDGNVFNGTPDDLEAMVLRPLSIEAGAAVAASSRVTLDLGGLDGEEIRTSPDGVTWSEWRPLRGGPLAEMASTEGPQTLFVQLRADGGAESPVFSDDITLDLAGPLLSSFGIGIDAAAVPEDGSLVPVTVRWAASDDVTGLADTTVDVACDVGASASIHVPAAAVLEAPTPWEATTVLEAGSICRVTLTTVDGIGNVTTESLADVAAAHLPEDPSDRVTHVGEWHREETAGAIDGAAHVAATPESSLEAVVTGDEAAIVAMRGPAGGQATVSLDGEAVATVDLYAAEPGGPEVVATVGIVPGTRHVLSVTPDGTAVEGASGTDVAIDGFLVLTTEPGGLEVVEPTPEPEPSVAASPSPVPEATDAVGESPAPSPSTDVGPIASPGASGLPGPSTSPIASSSPVPAVDPSVAPSPSPGASAQPVSA